MPLDLHSSEETGLHARIRQLVGGRLAIAIALLVATFIFRPGGDQSLLGRSFLAVLAVTSTHLFAAVVFGLIYLFKKIKRLTRFAFLQLVWDLLFTTALISISGGIESQFKFLYWLAIMNSAFLLFRAGAFSSAALSGIFYATLVNLQFFRRIPVFFANVMSDPGTWQEEKVMTSIVMNSVTFFVVAYVSSLVSGVYRKTETKLAEKNAEIEDLEVLMGRIVESLTSGLATLDPSGKVSYWNTVAEQITGISFAELRNRDLVEFFPGVHQQLANPDSLARFRENSPWRLETTFQSRDGQEKVLGFSVASLRQADKTTTGTLVMFQDLTKYRELENKVRKADRLAIVGELAARMAHEIRNPLTSVSGAIQMLRNQSDVRIDDQRLMDIVVRETDRLNQLLTDFLLFARPTTPQFEEILVDHVIKETAELFTKSQGEGKIRVKLSLDSNVLLWGDSRQINQMVWNLLKNAADAMNHTGEIEVRLKAEASGKGVIIEVQDQGPGVPSEAQLKIFQPFFTTKIKGTGLGLSVVHRIVEDHGGSVTVENAAEHGAIFRVYLQDSHSPQQISQVGIA